MRYYLINGVEQIHLAFDCGDEASARQTLIAESQKNAAEFMLLGPISRSKVTMQEVTVAKVDEVQITAGVAPKDAAIQVPLAVAEVTP